ncbi:cobaltochelatase subunit [methanogenic archaeon mixed culture ISO4-G1]|nr:cobaltochelatase subunit [methanogenic archaeon mixed culture ISO4-G1]
MEDSLRALECLMCNPDLHGLLIKGPAGSGKSALIHSFSSAYTGKKALVIPQNITDEQLFGTIDLEEVLATGNMSFEPGLLGKEDGILLVDDVNLLPRNMSLALMDSVHRGRVHIEREGLSVSYPCRVKVVATANDREQPLNSAVNDLFDMCVVLAREPDQEKRVAVMRNVMGESQDELGQDQDLVDRINVGKANIKNVGISDDMLSVIVKVCDEYGTQGLRGELSAASVARASAALDGRREVESQDVEFALKVCVPHRRTRAKKKEKEEKEDRVLFYPNNILKKYLTREKPKPKEKKVQDMTEEELSEENVSSAADSGSSEKDPDDDVVFNMASLFDSIDLLEDSRKKRGMDTHLLRRYMKDTGRDGRYVSSRHAENTTDDLAIDATIRYAAPYQKKRRESTGRDGVIIMPSDLRQKVRERHTSCMFFFMIDNSGSLIIRARMRAVKAAIMSMLTDHYIRRDSVAIMTFNQDYIRMLLSPTRSVGGVQKVIEDIPAGSKTPLSGALVYMHEYVGQYLRKHPADVAFVVLMTDADANISIDPDKDPFEEALEIASRIRMDRLECAMVDIKVSNQVNDKARKLAYALQAPYYKIEDLKSSEEILNR